MALPYPDIPLLAWENSPVFRQRSDGVYSLPARALAALLVVIGQSDVKQQHDAKDTDKENVAG